MDLGQWLSELRTLHEKARAGTLGPAEQKDYRARRAELVRALLSAQCLTRQPGQSARQSLRVARALQAELVGPGRRDRLTTFDVSAGGFSAPMGTAPVNGEMFTATLRLPGTDPLVTPVKVVASVPMVGYFRVSFSFGRMDPAAAERLDMSILDMVLQQLGPSRPRPADG